MSKIDELMVQRSLCALRIVGEALVPAFPDVDHGLLDIQAIDVVGIEPRIAEKDDWVVVIDGSAVPMVVRPAKDEAEELFQVIDYADFMQLADGELLSRITARNRVINLV